MKRFFPAIVFVLAAFWIGASFVPAKKSHRWHLILQASEKFRCWSAAGLSRSIPLPAIRS